MSLSVLGGVKENGRALSLPVLLWQWESASPFEIPTSYCLLERVPFTIDLPFAVDFDRSN